MRQIGEGEVNSLTHLRQVSRSREQLPLELGENSFPFHFLDQCSAVQVEELRGLAAIDDALDCTNPNLLRNSDHAFPLLPALQGKGRRR